MGNQELDRKLKQILEDLKPYQPEKVILYGSYAKGNPRRDSDIDLLIIKETDKEYFENIREVCQLLRPKKYYGTLKYIKGLDPIVLTPSQIRKRLSLGDFFVEDIIREGKVIYEKPEQ